jgi:hypothetical protein
MWVSLPLFLPLFEQKTAPLDLRSAFHPQGRLSLALFLAGKVKAVGNNS